jgi:hypothetical protein
MFRKKQPQLNVENAVVAKATTVDVRFGRAMFEKNSGASTSLGAKRTMRLRIEAEGALPYEAELVLKSGDPMVPIERGVTFEVLVDPDDPQHIALAPETVFALPGGGTWKPDPSLGIGRKAADAAMARVQELSEAAERAREQSAGDDPTG